MIEQDSGSDDQVEVADSLVECVEAVGISLGLNHVADLRKLDVREIVNLCQALVVSGRFLLHGSNSKVRHKVLVPMHADDAAKASGNQNAVYASSDVYQALLHATLNRGYLSQLFSSFTIAYRVREGTIQVRVTDNVYSLFQAGDQNVRSEGFVYVLRRAAMRPAADSPSEYHCSAPIVPLATLIVPRSVGESLLTLPNEKGKGTLMRFSKQELEAIATHLEARQKGSR
jgi:hypothetical protein